MPLVSKTNAVLDRPEEFTAELPKLPEKVMERFPDMKDWASGFDEWWLDVRESLRRELQRLLDYHEEVTAEIGDVPGTVASAIAALQAQITATIGTPPTGTGFRHMTAGAEDAASKLVSDADVAAAAGITENKLSLNFPTHSNANDPAWNEKQALDSDHAPGPSNRYLTDSQIGLLLADASLGNINVNLPSALSLYKMYTVKRIDNSAFTVTVLPFGFETIDGETTVDLWPYESMTVMVNGSNWAVV